MVFLIRFLTVREVLNVISFCLFLGMEKEKDPASPRNGREKNNKGIFAPFLCYEILLVSCVLSTYLFEIMCTKNCELKKKK